MTKLQSLRRMHRPQIQPLGWLLAELAGVVVEPVDQCGRGELTVTELARELAKCGLQELRPLKLQSRFRKSSLSLAGSHCQATELSQLRHELDETALPRQRQRIAFVRGQVIGDPVLLAPGLHWPEIAVLRSEYRAALPISISFKSRQSLQLRQGGLSLTIAFVAIRCRQGEPQHPPMALRILVLPDPARWLPLAGRVDTNRMLVLETFGIFLDHVVRSVDHMAAGAVVLDQELDVRLVLLAEALDELIAGLTPFIDILIIVAHSQNA